jgi:hypothetical protein
VPAGVDQLDPFHLSKVFAPPDAPVFVEPLSEYKKLLSEKDDEPIFALERLVSVDHELLLKDAKTAVVAPALSAPSSW